MLLRTTPPFERDAVSTLILHNDASICPVISPLVTAHSEASNVSRAPPRVAQNRALGAVGPPGSPPRMAHSRLSRASPAPASASPESAPAPSATRASSTAAATAPAARARPDTLRYLLPCRKHSTGRWRRRFRARYLRSHRRYPLRRSCRHRPHRWRQRPTHPSQCHRGRCRVWLWRPRPQLDRRQRRLSRHPPCHLPRRQSRRHRRQLVHGSWFHPRATGPPSQ
mmetsp:Transcript_12346/g.40542  ORF Transcript_12346/g.40542 Transcript_12346/m.40542 type:complete len:225 (-) Transcript_12346:778-1452(-)